MITRHELPPILERVAGAFEPELRRQLMASLASDRDRRVAEWVFDWYADPVRRRWYDPFHICYSTLFAIDLVAAENAGPAIVPAVLLHDIGYAALFAAGGKTAWRDAASRITHMQEGAALAARVLAELEFSPEETETIVGMVAVHDNPYLGIPLQGDRRLLMRDCDRAWVMHPLSFYKDWSAKGDDDPNRDLPFFLAVRRVHFFGDSEAARHDVATQRAWGITPAALERALPRVEPPFSPYARAHIDAQFRRRREESLGCRELFASAETFERTLSQLVFEEGQAVACARPASSARNLSAAMSCRYCSQRAR